MKKISLIFISLILLFLLVPKSSLASYGDVCNPDNAGIKYDDTQEGRVVINQVDPKIKVINVKLKCDGQTVKVIDKRCAGSCQIAIQTAGLKGSCNIYTQTKTLTSGGGGIKTRRCSIPVQTIVLQGKLTPDFDKCGVVANLNAPINNYSQYRVVARCEGGGVYNLNEIDASYASEHTYIFSLPQYLITNNNGCPLSGKCSFSLIDPHGHTVTTANELIKEAEAQDEKAHPNDPCSLLSGDDRLACRQCMGTEDNPTNNVWTVFGCINMGSSGSIFNFFFNFLSYMVGGIAALLLIYASFLYMTSGGDSEKIKRAQTLITAIVSGILFIIFSIMIMRFVGITLFDLPTLKTTGQ